MRSKISNIIARQIINSRGYVTVEVDVILESGAFGRASFPSGTSISRYEAIEIKNEYQYYLEGKNFSVIKNINKKIRDKLIGINALDQRHIDQTLILLDGTHNKNFLGANAIMPISLACARAAASHMGKPLYRYLMNSDNYIMPVPMINIINGGMHARNFLEFQEFMIMPVGFESFFKAIKCSLKIFHNLEKILVKNSINNYNLGLEGGYSSNQILNNKIALDLIMQSIELSGYKPGKEVFISLDIASNNFFHNNYYHLKSEDQKYSTKSWINYLKNIISNYPIISIEDPIANDDIEGWIEITKILGNKIQIVGDDIFATNSKFFINGLNQKFANSIIIKISQIGTLSEAFEVMAMAAEAGYTSIVSHRSCETEDSSIADITVATSNGQIKTGSMAGSERLIKYNQLLRIEEELGDKAIYPGFKALNFK